MSSSVSEELFALRRTGVGLYRAVYTSSVHDRLLALSGDQNQQLHSSEGQGVVMGLAHFILINRVISLERPEQNIWGIDLTVNGLCYVNSHVILKIDPSRRKNSILQVDIFDSSSNHLVHASARLKSSSVARRLAAR